MQVRLQRAPARERNGKTAAQPTVRRRLMLRCFVPLRVETSGQSRDLQNSTRFIFGSNEVGSCVFRHASAVRLARMSIFGHDKHL